MSKGDRTELEIAIRDLYFKSSDRRSLYTQIKGFVAKAQEAAAESLEKRRVKLKAMLDAEETLYQEEFSAGVKNRYNEEIKKREIALLEIQNQQKLEKEKFLRDQFMLRKIEVCQEIKDALLKEKTLNARDCQLAQILEKERKVRREKELDKYWERVAAIRLRNESALDQQEEEYRRKCRENNKKILLCQIEENKMRAAQKREEVLEDAKRMDAIRREMELEELDRKLRRRSDEGLKRGQEQRDEIERRARKRCLERERLADEHRELMAQIQKELVTDNTAAQRAKEQFREKSLEFMAYVKRIRKLEEDMQANRDARANDLHHIDECCVRDSRNTRAYRKEQMAAHNAACREQLVEECRKREREEIEYADRAIIENRFARDEYVSPAVVAENQRKYREAIDKQIRDIQAYYKQMEEEYERSLLPAADDPEDCKNKYEIVQEYLRTHPNWITYACAPDRTAKVHNKTKVINWEDVPPEGILPPEEEDFLKCKCDDKCFKDKNC